MNEPGRQKWGGRRRKAGSVNPSEKKREKKKKRRRKNPAAQPLHKLPGYKTTSEEIPFPRPGGTHLPPAARCCPALRPPCPLPGPPSRRPYCRPGTASLPPLPALPLPLAPGGPAPPPPSPYRQGGQRGRSRGEGVRPSCFLRNGTGESPHRSRVAREKFFGEGDVVPSRCSRSGAWRLFFRLSAAWGNPWACRRPPGAPHLGAADRLRHLGRAEGGREGGSGVGRGRKKSLVITPSTEQRRGEWIIGSYPWRATP